MNISHTSLAAMLAFIISLNSVQAENSTANKSTYQLTDEDYFTLNEGLLNCSGSEPKDKGGCRQAAEILLRSPNVTALIEQDVDGSVTLTFDTFEKSDGGSDYRTIFDLLDRGCDLGDARSCYRIADLYKTHEAFTARNNRIVSFYELACGYGLKEGCKAVFSGVQNESLDSFWANEHWGKVNFSWHQSYILAYGDNIAVGVEVNRIIEKITMPIWRGYETSSECMKESWDKMYGDLQSQMGLLISLSSGVSEKIRKAIEDIERQPNHDILRQEIAEVSQNETYEALFEITNVESSFDFHSYCKVER